MLRNKVQKIMSDERVLQVLAETIHDDADAAEIEKLESRRIQVGKHEMYEHSFFSLRDDILYVVYVVNGRLNRKEVLRALLEANKSCDTEVPEPREVEVVAMSDACIVLMGGPVDGTAFVKLPPVDMSELQAILTGEEITPATALGMIADLAAVA